MPRTRIFAVMVLAPVLAVFIAAGCSKEDKQAEDSKDKRRRDTKTAPAAAEPVAAKAWGTLKGKVSYDGEPPMLPPLIMNKDTAHCEKGDKRNQTWKVGPDKGVANVVVWLRAGKGKYFEIPDDQKKPGKQLIELHQPFCAFMPHVFVLYPSYWDGKNKKHVPTDQKFQVFNDAPIAHNTNWNVSPNAMENTGSNELMTPNSKREPIGFVMEKKPGDEEEVNIKCNVHTWMSAYGRAFDHPYAAVTGGDAVDAKDFGNYKIDKVPAGVEVDLVYWHESMSRPKVLKEKITLKEGDNTEDFKIKQQ